MKRWLIVAALVCAAVGAGVAVAVNGNYNAHLNGDSEVPATASQGQGQANCKLSNDGSVLECKLIASNIENVVAAHIHLGPEGVNGPVVAFLYAAAPGEGRTSGELSTVSITAGNLVGPLAGRPLSELVEAIEAGDAYVNVHTNDGVPPTNTGPGDFPGGEIRGQLP